MGTALEVGLLSVPLTLVRAPIRLSLKAAELGLSTAAEAARIGKELLNPDSGTPPPDFSEYRSPVEDDYGVANGAAATEPVPADVEPGSPSEPETVTPETGYIAPEPGEAGPEPDVLDVAAAEADATASAVDADAAVADAPPSIPDELIPDHVDEEPVLVAEAAEEGAEDGAGAELTVEPPWDGYDRMTAADIRGRLSAATAAEAAAVELYESTHKSRRSVMDAAARALRS
jgi:hypothetical protein